MQKKYDQKTKLFMEFLEKNYSAKFIDTGRKVLDCYDSENDGADED